MADLKEFHVADRAELEKSLAAFTKKLKSTNCRIQKFELNKDTLDDLATRVEHAEAKSRSSQ